MESTDEIKRLLTGLGIDLEVELKKLKPAESARTTLAFSTEFHEEIGALASRYGMHKKDVLDAAVLLLQEVLARGEEARGKVMEKVKGRSTPNPVRKSYAISGITRSKSLEMANQLRVSRKHLIGVGVDLFEKYREVEDESLS